MNTKTNEKKVAQSGKFLNDGEVKKKEVAEVVKATKMSKLYTQKVAKMVKDSGKSVDKLASNLLKSKPVDFKTQREVIYGYFGVEPKSPQDKQVRDLNGALNEAMIRTGKLTRPKNKQYFLWNK